MDKFRGSIPWNDGGYLAHKECQKFSWCQCSVRAVCSDNSPEHQGDLWEICLSSWALGLQRNLLNNPPWISRTILWHSRKVSRADGLCGSSLGAVSRAHHTGNPSKGSALWGQPRWHTQAQSPERGVECLEQSAEMTKFLHVMRNSAGLVSLLLAVFVGPGMLITQWWGRCRSLWQFLKHLNLQEMWLEKPCRSISLERIFSSVNRSLPPWAQALTQKDHSLFPILFLLTVQFIQWCYCHSSHLFFHSNSFFSTQILLYLWSAPVNHIMDIIVISTLFFCSLLTCLLPWQLWQPFLHFSVPQKCLWCKPPFL